MSRSETPHDPDDERELIEVLREETPGEGIPRAVSDHRGGVMTMTRVTPGTCRVIRQLRDHLETKQIADLLRYSPSTISDHAQGVCSHGEDESGEPDDARANRGKYSLAEVTDPDTMVVTSAGSDRFHKNADGEPACGKGHRSEQTVNRGGVRDAVESYVWRDPCKACFWRHYTEGKVSRRIAEIEYELEKQQRGDK